MIKLYIKIHNKTGLKYFGKTSREDVYNYKGSGKYWSRHIKKHGYDVTTIILKEFKETDGRIVEYAMTFSKIFNIVSSNTWANLMDENGRDGNTSAGVSGNKNPMYGKKHSVESIEKNKISNSGKNSWWYGKTRSENYKEKMKVSWTQRDYIECPFCKLKSKSASIMSQYHFLKCKQKNTIRLYNDEDIFQFEGTLQEIEQKYQINEYQIKTAIKNKQRMFISDNPGQIGLYKKRGVYKYRNWTCFL